MSTLILRNRKQGTSTLIENEFIDKYMLKANGEYVKVYLLLLRYFQNPSTDLSISLLADILENTEGDILRALKYWEKEGLLALEFDSQNQLTALDFTSPDAAPVATSFSENRPEPSKEVTPTAPAKSRAPLTPEQRKTLKQLLFIAEQYLGKTLTRSDVEMITYFYADLGFSFDLVEYLIEYCVENGHKSMHYIQKVALAWSDAKITTVAEARNSSVAYNKTCYSILNAFGIKGRGPATAELDMIRKWTDKDGFDLALILEACNRTMSAIHQPSFEYTDKILMNWRAKNVHKVSDIQAADTAFEQERNAKKKAPAANANPNPNSKFRNFEERSYNMDELTRELLGI